MRHLTGAALCAALGATLWIEWVSLDLVSTTAAYGSWLLLAAALAWGPSNVVRRRPNPMNSYRRRDLGIWAALFGLLHLVAGTAEAMSERYVERYVRVTGGPGTEAVRETIFGAGASTGVLIGLVFLFLLLLSSDWTLRRLGTRWWKRLQRTSYLAFVVLMAHGVAFQWLEGRHRGLALVFAGVFLAVIVLQAAGVYATRAARARPR